MITHNLDLLVPRVATSLISGVITKNGVPIECEVAIYNRTSGEMLSKSKSKSDGKYVLLGTNFHKNFVIALDPIGEYNLAAQDMVE